MPVHPLGKCRPGKRFGCKAPVTAEALKSVIVALPVAEGWEDADLFIPGNPLVLPPPRATNILRAVLAHPENKEFGMFHWKKQEAICLRRHVLEEVIKKGLFEPGQDYAALVSAMEKIGYRVIDVDISVK